MIFFIILIIACLVMAFAYSLCKVAGESDDATQNIFKTDENGHDNDRS